MNQNEIKRKNYLHTKNYPQSLLKKNHSCDILLILISNYKLVLELWLIFTSRNNLFLIIKIDNEWV